MNNDLHGSGVLVIDKPAGLTSHDVVGRVRRSLGIRRVGHAGTLDPMATGVLVLGYGRATRLLTYLLGVDKAYRATIRLGWSSDTDDADGTVVVSADSHALARIDDADVTQAMATIAARPVQVPSAVSAIKIAGQRSYQRVRSGESVTLPAREVLIHVFSARSIERGADAIDIEVDVECGSGTYVRALARDLGSMLGVGGHLTALRRTRVGPFTLAEAIDLMAYEQNPTPSQALSPAAAAAMILPAWVVPDHTAVALSHGQQVTWPPGLAPRTTAVITDAGRLVSIIEPREDRVRSLTVFADPADVSGSDSGERIGSVAGE